MALRRLCAAVMEGNLGDIVMCLGPLVVLSASALVGYTFVSRHHAPASRNPAERHMLARSVSGAACRLPHRGRTNPGGEYLSSGLRVRAFPSLFVHPAQHRHVV